MTDTTEANNYLLADFPCSWLLGPSVDRKNLAKRNVQVKRSNCCPLQILQSTEHQKFETKRGVWFKPLQWYDKQNNWHLLSLPMHLTPCLKALKEHWCLHLNRTFGYIMIDFWAKVRKCMVRPDCKSSWLWIFASQNKKLFFNCCMTQNSTRKFWLIL